MENKQIALLLISKTESLKNDFVSLKTQIENILLNYMRIVRETSGSIPDKDSFIKIITIIADELIVLPQPYEIFDGLIFEFIFKLISKNILDKFLGNDWFDRLKKIIEK